jgi:tetraprenyl-beta-curcumene synthase
MCHALTPSELTVNYYRFRENQEDGGYLNELVKTCQNFLRTFNNLEQIQPALLELAGYYCDLQVHKHVTHEDRVPRLKEWFRQHQSGLPPMSWYEFSACSGSTLGIFCIVSYACRLKDMAEWVTVIKNGYFPWVQGLHIMMDYFIDQEEDRKGGDLNFCFYYDDENTMLNRLYHFIDQADHSIDKLPDQRFHMMINKGLLGIYLADRKVAKQKDVRLLSRHILKRSGGTGFFFFVNGWLYRRLKPGI